MDLSQKTPVAAGAPDLCAAPVGGKTPDLQRELTSGAGFAPMRVLVADDQAIAREVLCWMLKDEPGIEIVGVAANGTEAVEAIRREQPDLVLLDVEMPDLSGFDVVGQLPEAKRPVVIFVTANERFARRAFDVQATDYLLKPCTRDRLRVALGRARELVKLRQTQDLEQRLRSFFGGAVTPKASSPYLALNAEDRILFLKTSDILWIEFQGPKAAVHANGQTHTLADSLAALWQKLPREQFVRLNARWVINLEQVQELRSAEKTAVLLFRDGSLLTLDDAGLEVLRQFC